MRADAAKWLRQVTCILLMGLPIIGIFVEAAFAQSSSGVPTAQQLEAFRKLAPDQQRAVLEAVQGTARGDTGQQQPRSAEPVQPLPIVEEIAPEELPPRLGKRSTVIVAVELDEAAQSNAQQSEVLRDRRERIA